MQLLKITNIPIEYEYQIDHARLEVKQSKNPRYEASRKPSELNIRSQDVRVRLDTTEMRKSMGLENISGYIAKNAQKGMQAAQEVAARSASEGNQMADIAHGADISDIIGQRLFSGPPETMQVFMPSVGPEITWEPNKLDMSYDPGDLKLDWQIMKNTMDFVPGKFTLNILQYPKVKIEYVGDPNYVPPSANPNYKEK